MNEATEVIKIATTFANILAWPIVVLVAAILFRPTPRLTKRIASLRPGPVVLRGPVNPAWVQKQRPDWGPALVSDATELLTEFIAERKNQEELDGKNE